MSKFSRKRQKFLFYFVEFQIASNKRKVILNAYLSVIIFHSHWQQRLPLGWPQLSFLLLEYHSQAIPFQHPPTLTTHRHTTTTATTNILRHHRPRRTLIWILQTTLNHQQSPDCQLSDDKISERFFLVAVVARWRNILNFSLSSILPKVFQQAIYLLRGDRK